MAIDRAGNVKAWLLEARDDGILRGFAHVFGTGGVADAPLRG